VDTHPRAARENVRDLGLTDRATVIRADARRFLRRAEEGSYDLILCDPPYRLADRLAADLDPLVRGVLAESGRAMIESSPDNPLEIDLPVLTERTYGDTLIRVYGASR
jgi:16S rRNA (guanine966-N2)-methyltransferase